MSIFVPHFLQIRKNAFCLTHSSCVCPVSFPHLGQIKFSCSAILALLRDWFDCNNSILIPSEGVCNQGGAL